MIPELTQAGPHTLRLIAESDERKGSCQENAQEIPQIFAREGNPRPMKISAKTKNAGCETARRRPKNSGRKSGKSADKQPRARRASSHTAPVQKVKIHTFANPPAGVDARIEGDRGQPRAGIQCAERQAEKTEGEANRRSD